MIVSIKKGISTYDISVEPVTQLCGTNMVLKDFILDSLIKYFSGTKYAEYESIYENNIRINYEEVGRKYLTILSISNHQDIINMIKYTKNSKMKIYLDYLLNRTDFMDESNQIERALVSLESKVSKIWQSMDCNLSISFETDNLLDVVATADIKSGDRYLEQLSYAELLREFLKIMKECQSITGDKTVVILKNIDHFLSQKEYEVFIKNAKEIVNISDIYFILSTSLDGYTYIEDEVINGITAVNDILYHLPSLYDIEEFLKMKYPVNYHWGQEELILNLKNAVNKLGKEQVEREDIKSLILRRMINASEYVANVGYNKLSEPELACLWADKIV